nr:EamA family transporter [Fodinibius roseus]
MTILPHTEATRTFMIMQTLPVARWHSIIPGTVCFRFLNHFVRLQSAYTLSMMDASLATSFLYLVPVVTILQGWIWLGEVPEMMAILGGTVALAGAAVVNQN